MSVRQVRLGEVTYGVHLVHDEVVAIDGLPHLEAPLHLRRLGGTTVEVTAGDGGWRRIVDVVARTEGEGWWVFSDGDTFDIEAVQERPDDRSTSQPATLSAPMPATVLQVLVGRGQRVGSGDTLIVLEAMKMELPVRALHDGTVVSVACRVGEIVKPGVPLVVVDSDE